LPYDTSLAFGSGKPNLPKEVSFGYGVELALLPELSFTPLTYCRIPALGFGNKSDNEGTLRQGMSQALEMG
jgi:hypothetical protein